MRVFIRAQPCGDFVFVDRIGAMSELKPIAAGIRGSRCDICGKTIEDIEVHVDADDFRKQKELEAAPAQPRISTDFSRSFTQEDSKKSRVLWKRLGGSDSEILDDPCKNVLARVPETLGNRLRLIPVGVCPTYTVNAQTFSFPGCSTVPVILFHWGLASFIFCMNRIIVGSMGATYLGQQSKDGAAPTPPVVDDHIGARMAVGAVRRFLYKISSHPDVPTVGDIHKGIEYGLTKNIEMYVLAHEYGHAVLHSNGHSLSPASRDTPIRHERNPEQEFEADTWAQDLLLGRFIGRRVPAPPSEELPLLERLIADLVPTSAAPLLFFLYAEFLRRVTGHEKLNRKAKSFRVDISDCREAVSFPARSDTHPSPMKRFDRMKELFESSAPWQARSLVVNVQHIISSWLELLFGVGFTNLPPPVADDRQREQMSRVLGNIVDRSERGKHGVAMVTIYSHDDTQLPRGQEKGCGHSQQSVVGPTMADVVATFIESPELVRTAKGEGNCFSCGRPLRSVVVCVDAAVAASSSVRRLAAKVPCSVAALPNLDGKLLKVLGPARVKEAKSRVIVIYPPRIEGN